MKVSVAIITYKHEAFIRQTIDSVLAQQVPLDLEIVVGEDASPDGTRGILEAYAQRHPGRFRLLLRERNVGMMRNLVEVLGTCSGEFIAVVEGDDYWTSPDKLRQQIEFLEAHPRVAFCHHRIAVVEHPSGNELYEAPRPEFQRNFAGIHELLAGNYVHVCSVLLRRRLLPEFDEDFLKLNLGDWPMCVLLARHGSIGYLEQKMAAYRIHAHSSWSSRPEHWRQHQQVRMWRYLLDRVASEHQPTVTALIRKGYEWLLANSRETKGSVSGRSVPWEYFRWRLERRIRQKATALKSVLEAQLAKARKSRTKSMS